MRIARLLATTCVLVALISVPATPAAQARTIYGCNYLEFCLYRYNFQGLVARMKACTWYDVRDIYFTSYVNNQTRGTRAAFYDYARNRISYTKPATATGTTSLALRTAWVRPC